MNPGNSTVFVSLPFLYGNVTLESQQLFKRCNPQPTAR